MRKAQKPMPSTGTSGTSGVRNGRLSSGRVLRSTMTLAQTMKNAASVPRLTSCATLPIGDKPAISAIATPDPRMRRTGVCVFGLTLAMGLGSRPSRDIASTTRVRPKYSTSITVVMPARAPIEISASAQPMPSCLSASAMGALTSIWS